MEAWGEIHVLCVACPLSRLQPRASWPLCLLRHCAGQVAAGPPAQTRGSLALWGCLATPCLGAGARFFSLPDSARRDRSGSQIPLLEKRHRLVECVTFLSRRAGGTGRGLKAVCTL